MNNATIKSYVELKLAVNTVLHALYVAIRENTMHNYEKNFVKFSLPSIVDCVL